MRKKTIALAAASLTACTFASAQAQSSVTLYGIVDTGVVYINNKDGSRSTELRGGNKFSSRLGVRGVEDLGGGLNALFAFHPVGETAGIGELELVFRDIVLKAPRRAVILPVDIRRKAGVALNGLVGCPVQKEKRTGRDSRRKQNELDELFGQRAVKDFIQSDSPFPRPS